MELLKSQKEELFHMAKDLDFDPANLYWEKWLSTYSRETTQRLRVRGTDFFFSFEPTPGGRAVFVSPAWERVRQVFAASAWAEIRNQYSDWIKCVVREMKATDPWAEIRKQSISLDFTIQETTSDQPFSVKEHQQVVQTLAVIQGLLITYSKETNAKQEVIIRGIRQLEKAAESMDRKSWFQQAVGYIVSTATAMGLDPEKTKALFTALKNGLQGTIQLLTNHP